MTVLRLGVHRLPLAEAGLVRARLQLLAAGTRDFGWAFAHEAPYDAVIASADSPDLAAARKHHACAVSVIGDGEDGAAAGYEWLPRPLQPERLEAWLSSVRQTRLADRKEEPARTPSFKLKRWPPAALLHGDPLRLRMATLLSRRSMNVSDLASVSGVAPERCQLFLQLLQNFDLVDAHRAAPATAPLPACAPPRARGLVQSIRQRLGL